MKLQKCAQRFLTTIYWIGCFAGFIFQLMQVCQQYFEFKTSTWIELVIPKEIPIPALSFCIVYAQILNRTEFKKYRLSPNPPVLDGDPANKTNNYGAQVEAESSILTIGQILELTPHPHDTINSCVRRNPGMLDISVLSRDDCFVSMKMSKYYMQDKVCYRYSFGNISQNIVEVSHSLHWPGQSYGVNLKQLFPSARVFTFVDPEDDYPFYSRNFGKMFHAISGKVNFFYVSYRYNEVTRLPPPYETWCTDVKEHDMHRCKRSCLIEQLKTINRFPATEMTTDPIDLKHINFEDYKNQKMRDNLETIYHNCESRCQLRACHILYGMSSVISTEVAENLYSFRVMVPDAANLIISSHEKWSFLDFATYIFSCIGVWFGLSCASFNPKKIMGVKRRTDDNSRLRRLPSQLDRSPRALCCHSNLLSEILSRQHAMLTSQHQKINFLVQRVNAMESRQ